MYVFKIIKILHTALNKSNNFGVSVTRCQSVISVFTSRIITFITREKGGQYFLFPCKPDVLQVNKTNTKVNGSQIKQRRRRTINNANNISIISANTIF